MKLKNKILLIIIGVLLVGTITAEIIEITTNNRNLDVSKEIETALQEMNLDSYVTTDYQKGNRTRRCINEIGMCSPYFKPKYTRECNQTYVEPVYEYTYDPKDPYDCGDNNTCYESTHTATLISSGLNSVTCGDYVVVKTIEEQLDDWEESYIVRIANREIRKDDSNKTMVSEGITSIK